MAGVDSEFRMTIKGLAEKCFSASEMARLLGLPENNVRYHLSRIAPGAVDDCGLRTPRAGALAASQRSSQAACE